MLLGGFIGAIAGSALTLVAQWLQNRSLRKGAGRALYAEMMRNASLLAAASGSELAKGELSDATWLNVQRDVAQLLTPQDFATVASPYHRMPTLVALLRSIDARPTGMRRPSSDEATQLLAAWKSFGSGAEPLKKKADATDEMLTW